MIVKKQNTLHGIYRLFIFNYASLTASKSAKSLGRFHRFVHVFNGFPKLLNIPIEKLVSPLSWNWSRHWTKAYFAASDQCWKMSFSSRLPDPTKECGVSLQLIARREAWSDSQNKDHWISGRQWSHLQTLLPVQHETLPGDSPRCRHYKICRLDKKTKWKEWKSSNRKAKGLLLGFLVLLLILSTSRWFRPGSSSENGQEFRGIQIAGFFACALTDTFKVNECDGFRVRE